jgi:hypothetical protein
MTVARSVGRGNYEHNRIAKARACPQVLEHFVAIPFGQIQVEDNEVGGVHVPGAINVVNELGCGLAVGDYMDFSPDLG